MSGEYGESSGLEQVSDPAVLRGQIPQIIGWNTGGTEPETIREKVLTNLFVLTRAAAKAQVGTLVVHN